jgi:hypothetical protein
LPQSLEIYFHSGRHKNPFLNNCPRDRGIGSGLHLASGLPDGLFSNKKSRIWVNFRGPLNIFYDHLEYFVAI